MTKYRVAVVGGSIAGCAAGLALQRAGHDVEIFERSTSLQDRGAGIVTPAALRDELVAAGYLDADYATWPMAHRRWVIRDGSAPVGRLLWKQESVAVINNWGNLWRSLRSQVPDAMYRAGMAVDGVHPDGAGVAIATSDGSEGEYDAVVGADGYRSSVRQLMHPGSAPEFAGYVLWRGNYEESRISDPGPLLEADEDHSWFTVCFPGGHGVLYMMPGFENRADVGHRRLNWAVYAPQPEGREFADPVSIPPGGIDADLYAVLEGLLSEYFPPYLASLIRLSPRNEVSLQPIYDEPVDHYASGRLLLIGDAGTVTRPHTGSGATKALQDALALERIAGEHADWEAMAAAYDEERVAAGNALVDLGRRIGRAQVEQTPDWATMTPADFGQWVADTLSGERLYFYGDGED